MLGALTLPLLVVGCGASGSQPQAVSAPSRFGTPKAPGPQAAERATKLHLSRADCAVLESGLRRRLGEKFRLSADAAPPLSRCRLRARGTQVNVSLDTAYAAHQRYENRMVEQVQFNLSDPAKLPHPVPGVGDRSAYDHDANWVPAYNTLFAVRGNRWLTVSYFVAGERRRRLRAEAGQLALSAFRLSAR